MAGSFSQDLARLFGLPQERGGAVVQQLARVLQDRLQKSGEATIEGFGTLRLGDDGSLSFDPDDVLQQAVNHRYSGMKPIITAMPEQPEEVPAEPVEDEEILPPFISLDELEDDEPDPPVPDIPEQDQETFSVTPEDEGEILPPFIPPNEVADEPEMSIPEPTIQSVPETTDIDDDLEDIIGGVWTQPGDTPPDPEMVLGEFEPFEEADFHVIPPANESSAESPESRQEEPESPEEPDTTAIPAADFETTDEPPTPDSERPAEGPAATAKAYPKRRRKSAWPILFLFGLLILAILAFIWMFDGDRFLTPQETSETTTEEVIEETPEALLAEETPDDAVVEPETPEEEPEPIAEEDPLRGAAPVDPSLGGVTWVAYSEASRATAERRVETFRAQGFRSSVIPSTVRGVQRFRVAIGQFSSVQEAEAHRSELPAGLPSDIWISRL